MTSDSAPNAASVIPEQAVTAAAEYLHDDECNDGDTQTCGRWRCGIDPANRFHSAHARHVEYYRARGRAVLEAAAPLADTPPPAVTAAAAALHADRERIREGAASLAFTLYRPGNGSGDAHGSSMDVVPLAELLALIGGEDG